MLGLLQRHPKWVRVWASMWPLSVPLKHVTLDCTPKKVDWFDKHFSDWFCLCLHCISLINWHFQVLLAIQSQLPRARLRDGISQVNGAILLNKHFLYLHFLQCCRRFAVTRQQQQQQQQCQHQYGSYWFVKGGSGGSQRCREISVGGNFFHG